MIKIIHNTTNVNWSIVQFPFFSKRNGIYGYYVLTHDLKMLFFSGESNTDYEDVSNEFTITKL